MTEYNIEYLGVLCTGAEWNYKEPNKFLFTYRGRNFEFIQQQEISCSADTDHIKRVIEEQFLPWWKSDFAVDEIRFKLLGEINWLMETSTGTDYEKGKIDALKGILSYVLGIIYP